MCLQWHGRGRLSKMDVKLRGIQLLLPYLLLLFFLLFLLSTFISSFSSSFSFFPFLSSSTFSPSSLPSHLHLSTSYHPLPPPPILFHLLLFLSSLSICSFSASFCFFFSTFLS